LTGEGEISWPVILDLYGKPDFAALNKREKLESLAERVPGALAPALLDEGMLSSDAKSFREALRGFKAIVPPRLSFPAEGLPPHSPIRSSETEFAETRLVEISRGCPYGCRFCLAGGLYRPRRIWEKEKILSAINGENPWDGTSPFPEDAPVGFVSPAVADHPDFQWLVSEALRERRKISFSSVRLSAINEDLARLFAAGKLKGLAVAPEGTERMRAIMNKDLAEEEILAGAELLARSGLKRLKLYFMLGLPGETDEDLRGIAQLTERILKSTIKGKSSPFISVTVSNFAPKPHTAFEDAPLLTESELLRRGELLRNHMRKLKGVELKLDAPYFSIIQALIGRSGPNGGKLVKALWENGGKVKAALKSLGGGKDGFAESEREFLSERPWRIVAPPAGFAYLEAEREKSREGSFSPACPEERNCGRCGACG
jgi:radical SAM superfamily enzyme YgiQ (UPF0313 family)